LSRARVGDETALNELIRRLLPRLKRWATGRLPPWARDMSDTDDFVQEVVVRTIRRLDQFEPEHEGALMAYLRQALWNRMRDEYASRTYAKAFGELDGAAANVTSEAPSPLDQLVGREAMDRYERALAALRPTDRELVIARIELAYTYPELARATGKASADAARKAFERALLKLAETME
jgi:RNA polymerase sigma-70 factor (ECF subfamily)